MSSVRTLAYQKTLAQKELLRAASLLYPLSGALAVTESKTLRDRPLPSSKIRINVVSERLCGMILRLSELGFYTLG